jgi:hypothetical protein
MQIRLCYAANWFEKLPIQENQSPLWVWNMEWECHKPRYKACGTLKLISHLSSPTFIVLWNNRIVVTADTNLITAKRHTYLSMYFLSIAYDWMLRGAKHWIRNLQLSIEWDITLTEIRRKPVNPLNKIVTVCTTCINTRITLHFAQRLYLCLHYVRNKEWASPHIALTS